MKKWHNLMLVLALISTYTVCHADSTSTNQSKTNPTMIKPAPISVFDTYLAACTNYKTTINKYDASSEQNENRLTPLYIECKLSEATRLVEFIKENNDEIRETIAISQEHEDKITIQNLQSMLISQEQIISIQQAANATFSKFAKQPGNANNGYELRQKYHGLGIGEHSQTMPIKHQQSLILASAKPGGLFQAVSILEKEGIEWDSNTGRQLLCDWGILQVEVMGVVTSQTYCNASVN